MSAKLPSPAWHDAPTMAGNWLAVDGCGHAGFRAVSQLDMDYAKINASKFVGERWYGPIPFDSKAKIGSLLNKGRGS